MTETIDNSPTASSRPGGLARLGRFLMSPLRRLTASGDDPQAARIQALSDEELADALLREVYAAQNADDEIWIEGTPFIQEAARRLRTRSSVSDGAG